MGNSVCCQAVCDKAGEQLTDDANSEQVVNNSAQQINGRIKSLEAEFENKKNQYAADQGRTRNGNGNGNGGATQHVTRKNPNGTMYDGQMRDNAKSGWGRYTYVEPAGFFEGEWQDNRAHGLGHFKDTAGEYKGYWLQGEKDGLGSETWFDDGTVFRGYYTKGVKQGDGIYLWSDGSSYEGQLKDNVICGQGRLTDEEGIYVGEFLDNAQHGEGRWQYSNGDFYDSLRHGEGTLSWTHENKRYAGQWSNGVPHGKGLVTVRNLTKDAWYISGKSCTQQAWEKHLKQSLGFTPDRQ
eukprot:g16782.t1